MTKAARQQWARKRGAYNQMAHRAAQPNVRRKIEVQE